MRKTSRRLALRPETLRRLTAADLRTAAGGFVEISTHPCSFAYSCVVACSAGSPITTCNPVVG